MAPPKLPDEERKARARANARKQDLRKKERAEADPEYAAAWREKKRAADRASYARRMADPEARKAHWKKRSRQQKAYRDDRRERIREIDRMAKARSLARDPEAYLNRQRAGQRQRYWANRDRVLVQQKAFRQKRKSRRESAQTIAFTKAQRPGFSSAVMSNRAYNAASAAVPRTLPAHVRDDVISDIVMACLEGSILLEEVPSKAKGFVSSYWKGRDFFGTMSLDAPIGEDGSTFLDFVAAPDQDLDEALDGLRS